MPPRKGRFLESGAAPRNRTGRNVPLAIGTGKKFLLIPPNGIGDNLMMLPVAACIRQWIPDAEIHTLSNEANAASEMMGYSPCVDRIQTYSMPDFSMLAHIRFLVHSLVPLWLMMHRESYDHVITIVPNPLRRLMIFWIPRSSLHVQFNRQMNQIAAGLSTLKGFQGIPENPEYGRLLAFDNEHSVLEKFGLKTKEYTVFHFYGATEEYTWPEYQRFISAWDSSVTRCRLIVAGQHKGHIPLHNVLDLVNKTRLYEVSVIIRNCRLFITTEGGLFHIGIAQKVPVIGLFGFIPSELRSPVTAYPYFRAFDSTIPLKNQYRKSKYRYYGFNLLEGIDAQKVMDEAVDFLSGKRTLPR